MKKVYDDGLCLDGLKSFWIRIVHEIFKGPLYKYDSGKPVGYLRDDRAKQIKNIRV